MADLIVMQMHWYMHIQHVSYLPPLADSHKDGHLPTPTYSSLVRNVESNVSCIHYSFGVIICDESHALKSHSAKRTQFMWPLVQQASRAILITGTPALSRPIELFPQVSPART